MDFVDFVLYGLGFSLISVFSTWIISHQAAFKKGLIAGLERGHREGFDVGFQAGVYEMTFGEEKAALENLRSQTLEEIDDEFWAEELMTTDERNDSFESAYKCREAFNSIS